MPEISRFQGIIIRMYFADHAPPHFHVEYQNYKAQVSIASTEILAGDLPVRQLRLVQAWAILHEKELLNNFDQLKNSPSGWNPIDPLK